MCWIIRDLNPLRDKSYTSIPSYRLTAYYLTRLCLEINRAGVGRAVNRYGLCLEMNRAGVRSAVNRYQKNNQTSAHG